MNTEDGRASTPEENGRLSRMSREDRLRLSSLVLCVVGAGMVWFNPSDELRGGTRAVALVALAGVGAIVAGRGLFRRLTAVAMVGAGLWLILGGTALSIVGGIIVVAGAVIAATTCQTWPVMGARYERVAEVENSDLWSALDRGDDPTVR